MWKTRRAPVNDVFSLERYVRLAVRALTRRAGVVACRVAAALLLSAPIA